MLLSLFADKVSHAHKVLDRYTDRGTIAMGKVESGTIVKGQQVVLLPMKVRVLCALSLINLFV